MSLPPEVQQQLAEQKKQCVFCKIVSKEIESKIVFEDAKTMAILDIAPALKGHTLYFPKEHYPLPTMLFPDESNHFYGLIPQLAKSIKSAMVSTGFNVFIANGGVAGQQVPHFMLHLIPREPGDGFFNFWLNSRKASLDEEKKKALETQFPQIAQKILGKEQNTTLPPHLKTIASSITILYQDESLLCSLPNKGAAAGHIEIYSKTENSNIERLSSQDSIDLFTLASLAARFLFELCKAQGTNIIIKSGNSDDNQSHMLSIHILARQENDSLQNLLWERKQTNQNLDPIKDKIKDKTWNVKYQEQKNIKEQQKIIPPLAVKPQEPQKYSSSDEIKKAIEKLQR